MNIRSISIRAAFLGLILMFRPTPSILAQSHTKKHDAPKSAPARHDAPEAATPQKPATAQTKTDKVEPTNTAPKATSGDDLLSSLHEIKTHLMLARPDGRGHRTRAIQGVETAIKLLSPPTATAKPTPTSSPGEPARAATSLKPPAKLDKQLDDARELLQAVESQMSGDGINGHQFIRAKGAIQGAIRELNLALVDR